jgi:rubrerythrin
MSGNLKFSAEEALYIALRMEERAISMYERALLVFSLGELKQVITGLLGEEKEHWDSFRQLMGREAQPGPERMLLLDDEAGKTLFSGGLTGAVREGAFDSGLSLLQYAADEEEHATKRYRDFALLAQGEARKAFLTIAEQEEQHLERLQAQIRQNRVG